MTRDCKFLCRQLKARRRRLTIYKNVKVLDIHGHVSAPGGNGSQLVGGMLASNTPTRLDPHNDLPNLGFNEQSWANSVKRHTDQMDDHNIDVVTSLCRRVVVLDQGRKLAEGTPGDIVQNQAVREAYLGG